MDPSLSLGCVYNNDNNIIVVDITVLSSSLWLTLSTHAQEGYSSRPVYLSRSDFRDYWYELNQKKI